MRGVCSAGFAITVLPAASAAATWPVKMASGKFHGLMQANTPRPWSRSSLRSPAGPASSLRGKTDFCLQRVVTTKIGGLAHFCDRVAISAAAFAHDERHQLDHVRFQPVGGTLDQFRALLGARLRPRFEGVGRARNAEVELLRRSVLDRRERRAGRGLAFSSSRTSRSDRSSPSELRRSGYRSRGSGMRGSGWYGTGSA